MRALGFELVPAWQIQWWTAAASFQLWGCSYPCFYHAYNCGWPPYVSERCVELALVDAWLAHVPLDELVEVGAVTPYYWPGRVARIIDPFDSHPRVTDRKSLFDVPLAGRRVLSISTFEHIGTGDYGISESPELTLAAFRKVFDESPQFLVTVPTGYNRRMDSFLFDSAAIPADVAVGFLVRDGRSDWRQEHRAQKARRAYGDPTLRRKFPDTCIGQWANAIVVLERGGTLASSDVSGDQNHQEGLTRRAQPVATYTKTP
jgi:hypothetical protein